MKLNGVMLGTSDAKKLGEFYGKLFGAPVFQQDQWYGFNIGGGMLMIGPHSEVSGKNSNPARIMVTYTTDDLKSEFDRLVEQGASVVAEPYQPEATNDPDTWLATVADIDGNYLQLSTPWKN